MPRTKERRNMSVLVWEVLLALILCVPRGLQLVKILLILTILIAVATERRDAYYLDKFLLVFLLIWMVRAAIELLNGFLNQNTQEGLVAFLRVEILDVLLYVVLLSAVHGREFKNASIRVIVFSNIFIGIQNCGIVFMTYLGYDASFLLALDVTSGIGWHEGYTHLVSTNLSMSILTFPITALLLLNGDKDFFRGIYMSRYTVLASVFLIAVAMLLSGRRALWLVLVATLLFVAVGGRGSMARRMVRMLGVLVISLLTFLVIEGWGFVTVGGISERMTDAVFLDTVRQLQGSSLIATFFENPIVGLGAGAVSPLYVRAPLAPWSYEMSYHVELMRGGLLGFSLYVWSLGSLVWEACRQIDSNKVFAWAALAGLVAVIAANSSNPYFSSSFDFLIMLFLPAQLLGCADNNRASNK